MSQNTTIAVAMSGGVDSSTVAAILAHAGGTVIGLTLQLWDQTRLAGRHGIPDAPKAGRCCSLDDVYDARHVAEQLGIPYYVVNQEDRFERDVVRPFVADYMAGRTPIPCSLCNNHIKFDQLLQTARSIGASRIATGHYAVNEYDPVRGRWILKRPVDSAKDQTYFLFGLTQEQLAHTLFPLGHLTKPEVREMARHEKHRVLVADTLARVIQRPDEMTELLAWAVTRITAGLSVDDLARRAAVSPRTLTRRFRQATGLAPGEWLQGERLRLARRLLETSDDSIERVSQNAGYDTTVAMRAQFARRLHTSPRAYRRMFRAA